MPFDLDALRALNARLSSEQGISVVELRELLTKLFEDERSAQDLNDYRIGTRPWKKLRDEVIPVSAFIDFVGFEGNVRFPLDNLAPDAWFTPVGGQAVGIEVTRALGRADFELAKEMVRDGIGRGFLGLQDNAPKAAYDLALQRDRIMYSSRQALATVDKGIRRCLEAKDDTKYAGMWLLVVAPLRGLPQERWEAIVPTLQQQAARLPFDQVHVFDAGGRRAWGFQIK